MESVVLRKKLNTYKSAKGTLKDVGNDVVMEVLRGWESWAGKSRDYYREIGLSRMQLVNMIKKGKRLVKSGAVTEGEFREITLPSAVMGLGGPASAAIEMRLEGGRAVAFSQVDLLVEFLKKMT